MKGSIPMSFGNKAQSDFSLSRIAAEGESLCPAHWHGCFEIIAVIDGEFSVIFGDDTRVLYSGDVAVIPPNVLHGTSSDQGYKEVLVFGYTEELIYSPDISFENAKYLSPFRYCEGERFRIIKANDKIEPAVMKLLLEISELISSDDFYREIIIRGKILGLHRALCSLYTDRDGSRAGNDSYLIEAQMYIDRNISENISPYVLADHLHLSYSHLSRLVRRSHGCSIGELILRMKLNFAEGLMRDDLSLSITDIAIAAGFNSPSYFARCFRRERGITPTQFREMLNKSTGADLTV